MRFEWDRNKNRSNIAKHGVGFETAIGVFDDPHSLSLQDRVVEGEERWRTMGTIDGVLLVVAHTWVGSDQDEVIRVISARKATPSERRAYAKNQKRPN